MTLLTSNRQQEAMNDLQNFQVQMAILGTVQRLKSMQMQTTGYKNCIHLCASTIKACFLIWFNLIVKYHETWEYIQGSSFSILLLTIKVWNSYNNTNKNSNKNKDSKTYVLFAKLLKMWILSLFLTLDGDGFSP